jgi:hypothetical protein
MAPPIWNLTEQEYSTKINEIHIKYAKITSVQFLNTATFL